MRLKYFAAVAGVFLFASAAHADTIDITLSNSTQTVGPNGTVTFSGMISTPLANSGTVYVNGDTATVSTGATVDDSAFFNDVVFGQYAYAPGDSFNGDFFTVTVTDPSAEPISGTFFVQGGATDTSEDTLAKLTFTVNAPASVTPEPASIALLGTGLLGMGGILRRRLSA